MRFIAVIVFLIAIAIAVGWFAFKNLDSLGESGVMRVISFVYTRPACYLSSFRGYGNPLQDT